MAGVPVTILLYGTIWAGLALLVLGEHGKRRLRAGLPYRAFWTVSAAGLALTSGHLVLALAVNDDWSHRIAWQVTEDRTRAMFGFGWGGLLVGNYFFVAAWAADLWVWRANPSRYAAMPAPVQWGIRLFVLGILVPAAVVFAAGPRRWMGVAIVLALVWIWRPMLR